MEELENFVYRLKAENIDVSKIEIKVPKEMFHLLFECYSPGEAIVEDNSTMLGQDIITTKVCINGETIAFTNADKTEEALARTIDEFNKVDRLMAVATNLALDPMINKEKLMQYRLEIMDDIIVHAGKLIGRF